MNEPIYKTDFLSLYHADCMEIMKQYPDKYFDLAIVDPPYGIHNKISAKGVKQNAGNKFAKMYDKKQWDKDRPTKEYWTELFRVSKNQIVCGANYFAEYLSVSRGWIFWDKMGEGLTVVNNELIYTSFDVCIKTFQRCHGLDKGFMAEYKTIHPTQKPTFLYRWLLQNYAKQGDKIIDTHFGSGSIALAVDKANRLDNMNLHLTACEIDKDYIEASVNRISQSIKQQVMAF